MVKCLDCGFLAMRHPTEGTLVEIDEENRVRDRFVFGSYHPQVLCAMDAFPLAQEAGKEGLQEVITRERPCVESLHVGGKDSRQRSIGRC